MPVFRNSDMSTAGSRRRGRFGSRWLFGFGGAVSLALVAMACSGNENPNTPTPPSGGGGVGGPTVMSLSLSITSGGLSTPTADLAVGGTVTVTNNDSRAHDMDSDPHPAHTDCPSLNIGPIAPGQTRTSNPQGTARACGMHDHDNPGSQSLMRTIVIR